MPEKPSRVDENQYHDGVPRIGFDGRALASPAAGVRRYTAELFGALAAPDHDLTIVAVGAPATARLPPGVERGPCASSLPTNAGWMLSGLPRAANQARLDLFHAPAYTVPFGGPRPLAVTIHDVSYERHPEWYPYRRDPIRRAFYRRSARAADRVITDSAFSKSEIAAAYRLDHDRIAVVPLAPAARFSPGPPLPLPAGTPRRYVLHVGDLHARRNLAVVVAAMSIVRGRRGLGDVGLVLAGAAHEAHAALGSSVASSAADPLLTVTGRVDENLLLALYRSAAALVYPSRYEGFGLPLLEAMACGIPVIASGTSCIPEVTGGAAVLLDADDPEAWSAAIERVLDDRAHADALSDAGRRRASVFSWQRTAGETAAVYRSLLADA